MSDRVPEDLPGRMPCQIDMPEDIHKICQIECQIDMPEYMPEDMSEYMPEDMPDRMPEDMQKIYAR